MTDPTTVEGIVVVGQRRPAGSTGAYGGGGGGLGDGPGEEQEQVPEDPGEGGGVALPLDPCSSPATRLEWNADAAAAEALRQIVEEAIQRDGYLGFREYGAVLYRQNDGSVHIGNITHGRPFNDPDPDTGRSTVDLDYSGIDPGSIIGTIHTHNPGSFRPSYFPSENRGDWAHFDGLRDIVFAANNDPNIVRIYIGAQEHVAAGVDPNHRVHVYDHRNRDDAINGDIGPEVNPEGQPCP